ncbi:methyl-accepting chemotaxis protein [Vibrio maritimus]|uniref:methyl-accepting chemotaxis protein n=1 Tax=Vibrio maritimus TaxID=990268 RepID=UPI001F31CC74|nr:methyl-accepting chemotaxis protein [Vibrio maritimus]
MNRLTKKIILVVTLVMTLVTAIALSTQYVLTKKNVEADLAQVTAEIEQELQVILQEPVYVYDKALIGSILDAYIKNGTISSIVVRDQNGKEMNQVRQQAAEFESRIAIKWDGLPIGSVSLGFNSQQARSELQSLMLRSLMMFGTLYLVVIVSLGYIMDRLVVTPIKGMAKSMNDIAAVGGDLTSRVTATSNDEVSDLAKAFNRFVETVQEIVIDTARTTESLKQNGSAITSVRTSVSEQTENQLKLTHESLSKIEQFNLATSEIAANTENTLFKSNDALSLGASSEQAIAQNVSNVEDLSVNLETAAERANALKNRSDDIGRVVEVIKAIAEQTNLLALNAAIEAARAGESGRGFAVVADEVRALASKTHDSTSEIESIIESLQQEATESFNATQESKQLVELTKVSSDEAQEALTKMIEAVTSINAMVDSVASACEEQSNVSNTVAQDMRELDTSAADMRTVNDELQVLAEAITLNTTELDSQIRRFKY